MDANRNCVGDLIEHGTSFPRRNSPMCSFNKFSMVNCRLCYRWMKGTVNVTIENSFENIAAFGMVQLNVKHYF